MAKKETPISVQGRLYKKPYVNAQYEYIYTFGRKSSELHQQQQQQHALTQWLINSFIDNLITALQSIERATDTFYTLIESPR